MIPFVSCLSLAERVLLTVNYILRNELNCKSTIQLLSNNLLNSTVQADAEISVVRKRMTNRVRVRHSGAEMAKLYLELTNSQKDIVIQLQSKSMQNK